MAHSKGRRWAGWNRQEKWSRSVVVVPARPLAPGDRVWCTRGCVRKHELFRGRDGRLWVSCGSKHTSGRGYAYAS